MQSTLTIGSHAQPGRDAHRASLSQYAPHALALLRIVTAALFVQAGIQLVFHFPAQAMPTPPEMVTIVSLAGILELVGGLLVLIGLFTRPAAFTLSGMMAIGYFMVHAPMSFFPTNNMGAAAILFCFVYLYLVFAGPGAWSVDGARQG